MRSRQMRIALGALAATTSAGLADLPDLRVDSAGRALETHTGEPFFFLADTAWRLFRLDPLEVDEYMAIRAAQGFTVIQGPVIVSTHQNYQFRVNDDPGDLDAQFMNHIDTIVDSAAEHGLYIAPVVMWGDHASQTSLADAYDVGYAIGSRYKHDSNVAFFIVAGEFNHPQPNMQIWNEVAAGLEAGFSPKPKLVTIHPKWSGGIDGQLSSTYAHGEEWLDFNMIQSGQNGDCSNSPGNPFYLGTHNWLLVGHDLALTPAKPTLDAEGTYEMVNPNHDDCDGWQPRWDAFDLRRRAYWSVFAGGFGHTYGANGVFQFHQQDWPATDFAPLHYWDDAILYPGAWDMGHLRALIESRPAANRIPDQGLIDTNPPGNVPFHQHATRDASGRWGMVYIPQKNRFVRIDVSDLSGSALDLWWFDPTDGSASFVETLSVPGDTPGGTFEITSPSSGEDWVLVIDNAAQGFGPPGEPPSGGGGEAEPDVNGDGIVNIDDLILVIMAWGMRCSCPLDVDGSGVVDVDDVVIILFAFD